MKTEFKSSFARDLRTIRDRNLLARIQAVIETVEQAEALQDIANLSKLQGGDNFYRIRVGDYRVGIVIESDTVIFVRCLNRREIYRYFP
ncbi:MAG: type II toxin-antitoxin system RelE/ParE family toxin [Armatimonadota bacterium]|nr:type II toxin-antitoxin system RelE/ParE family toxin [Armatimonadota bacterium]